MGLTWPLVLAVLAGALLHALWNALVKSSGDKPLDTALVHLLGALVALPFALWVGLPAAAAWPFMLMSLTTHIGYYFALAGAYQNGELSLTYPLMRGTAPLLVALGSATIIGEVPTAAAWVGILGITAGVVLVGLSNPGQALHQRKAIGFALVNACIIAAYTFIDGFGARASGDVMAYVLWLFVLDGVPYPLIVWLRRNREGRQAILAYARRRWPLAAAGGAASIGSYSIALWAMTRAPVASVAALRETSVLFAVLLSSLVLKERFGVQRALGAAVIVAGVVALRLG